MSGEQVHAERNVPDPLDTPASVMGSSASPPQPAVAGAVPGSLPGAGAVWERRWFQACLAALVIFLVLSFVLPGILGVLYAIRSVLLPVLVGLGLAYICNPLLTVARRHLRIGRLGGTVILMLLALLALVTALVTVVPVAIEQGQQLLNTAQQAYPKYVNQLIDRIDPPGPPEVTPEITPETSPELAPDINLEASPAVPSLTNSAPLGVANSLGVENSSDLVVIAEPVEEDGLLPTLEEIIQPDRSRRLLELSVARLEGLNWQQVVGWVTTSLDVGVGLVGSAVSFTSYLLLSSVVVAFCFFFFSWHFERIQAWFVPFIPASHRERTLDLVQQMDGVVSSFVRGRLVQTLVMMTVLTVGWWWAGVPYWLLLGLLTGLMNLVPFLPAAGWLLALVLTVVTTLANGGDFTFGLLLWPTVAYFLAQGLDGWVVEPIVQGKATNLDPLTVLLVVLLGGSLAGLLGMLLAIPLAACIKILCKAWLLPQLRTVAARW